MASFRKIDTLGDFQKFIRDVYAVPDDQLWSIWDLLAHQQRFAMRALKGIRKGDAEKIRVNLLISFSWLMAIVNRFSMNIEDEAWRRFPYLCSYCGKCPCVCKETKPSSRLKPKINDALRPHSLAEFQAMFAEIYPAPGRMIGDAGIHLAEEMGEVSEAIHNYFGQHRQKQFDAIKLEMADLTSCFFGVANSAGIDVAREFAKMYPNNCHICHEAPCVCSFSEVAQIDT
jgi:NTP pyrophosphatase (non-canonical NTP hydrolase)